MSNPVREIVESKTVAVSRVSRDATLQPRTGYSEPLRPLSDALFFQVPAAEWEQFAEFGTPPENGLIFTGNDAVSRVEEARSAGFAGMTLVDRRSYAGSRRSTGISPFDPKWLEAQFRAGCKVALTDSGYIGAGDISSLKSVLNQAVRLGREDVVTVLPLASAWLTNPSELIDRIGSSGRAVGLVLEHERDPIGKRANLFGLVRLLASVEVPVFLLSCDVSALGALAHGALAAGVGVRASLRHFYPQKRGGPVDRTESVFARPLLCYYKRLKLEQAIAADPDHALWRCMCRVCQGSSLEWIVQGDESRIRRHSVATVMDAHIELVRVEAGPDRVAKWQSWCSNSVFLHEQLAADIGIYWEAPSAIRRWAEVSPRLPAKSEA